MLTEFPTLDYAVAEEEFYTDRWGTWLTAYAPFYNSDGEREGILGIDISAATVVAQEQSVLYLILGTTVITLFVVTLIGLYLGNLYTRPIVNLAATAQEVAEGNLNARATIESTDEVGELAIIFNSMTSQLQVTLEGLEQRIAERTQALETSTQVGRRLSTILDQRELVREVVEQVRTAFDYYHAHIYLFDENKENLVMAGGTGEAGRTMLAQGHAVATGRGLVGRAGDTNLPILVPDVSQEEGWLPNPLLPDTKAEVAIPIAAGENVLGVLDVQDNEVGGLTEADVDLLQSVANQVASALQNARAYQQTQQQVAREALIANINQQIQTTSDIEEALQVAVRELGRALDADTSVRLTSESNSK
jgi:nitrate/nitrite-specific signal transduction histidine kinase